MYLNDENLPKNRQEAIRKFKNYIARVNRYRKKQGKKKAKYDLRKWNNEGKCTKGITLSS